MAKGKITHTFQAELAGRLRTWSMRTEPYSGKGKDDRRFRKAYEQGFRARYDDAIQGKDSSLPPGFIKPELEPAWSKGYADAKKQE